MLFKKKSTYFLLSLICLFFFLQCDDDEKVTQIEIPEEFEAALANFENYQNWEIQNS